MAFGKTPEEKALEAQVKQQRRAQQDAERARQAFYASPVGQATLAKEQQQGFFEVQLEVGSSQRDSTIWGGNNTNLAKEKVVSHAGTLSSIESVGWTLEHVGYVFVVTSESSRDKFLASGQQVAVSGRTLGIYLFRNNDAEGIRDADAEMAYGARQNAEPLGIEAAEIIETRSSPDTATGDEPGRGTTPPGWYPDASTPGNQRWWDGNQWTGDTAPL